MGAAWRELSKRASYERWWGHHSLVWEVTSGEDGLGHLHAHVAVVSSWVPYEELHVAWREAMPGARVLDVVSPADARERARARGRKYDAAGGAAHYLAKYVTKGVDAGEMTGRKAGELLVAFRNQRKVTTSRAFWRPLLARSGCKCCRQEYHLVGMPCSMQAIAPGAVLRAKAELLGWWVPRGEIQVGLRFDSG